MADKRKQFLDLLNRSKPSEPVRTEFPSIDKKELVDKLLEVAKGGTGATKYSVLREMLLHNPSMLDGLWDSTENS